MLKIIKGIAVASAVVAALLGGPAFAQGLGAPQVSNFGASVESTITRAANTTTYTAYTGWNNGTPTVFTFQNACRVQGGEVMIPSLDVWSSANPTTKLSGVVWLFSELPGTLVADDATFTIAAADFAHLTGSAQGIAFTLANATGNTGNTNSGINLSGTNYVATCSATSTTIYGMVEVTNAYVPASAEVLHVRLRTLGVN